MEKVILTPRKMVLPVATTLSSEFLEAYQEGIKSYDAKARKTLDIFSDRNGDFAGSNCFAPLELRKYLPKETMLATMADLGRATEINPGFLNGFYSDTGLVLRTAGDHYNPNDLLAKVLAEQLKEKGMPLQEGIPKIIYFDALNLKRDSNSAYGLIYFLNDNAEKGKNIIDTPELSEENYSFKTMDERGVPIKDNLGKRTCYTRKDGVSRFCLYWYSNAYSNFRNLADSYDDGRVVGVTSEAGSQKI